jgi:hypothetical protein
MVRTTGKDKDEVKEDDSEGDGNDGEDDRRG